ncbi:MAG: nucleotide pyrophosphohydrolase [Clostridiales bacterium]|nr:nucleotide pyrophosphohydrolase [Clostridiales bacterium]
MLELSLGLWEQYKDSWTPREPEFGRDYILYMVEEIGEAIAIIKKKGEDDIMQNAHVREHFVEELCDVFMYLADVLNSFGISAEEFSKIYMKKMNYNMTRWKSAKEKAN